MSPVWTEAPTFCQYFVSVCLCAPPCVYTCTELLGNIFRVNLECWKSASLSVTSRWGLKQTAWTSSTALWSFGARMRRQELSVPYKEGIASDLLWTMPVGLPFQLPCPCLVTYEQVTVTDQLWRCTFPWAFADARLLLLKKTFCLAWPAQDLHWSFWAHAWCTRCQLWSVMLGACPAQGSNLHHQAEIRRVPDLCAH